MTTVVKEVYLGTHIHIIKNMEQLKEKIIDTNQKMVNAGGMYPKSTQK